MTARAPATGSSRPAAADGVRLRGDRQAVTDTRPGLPLPDFATQLAMATLRAPELIPAETEA